LAGLAIGPKAKCNWTGVAEKQKEKKENEVGHAVDWAKSSRRIGNHFLNFQKLKWMDSNEI
jgi:hypothetical protein